MIRYASDSQYKILRISEGLPSSHWSFLEKCYVSRVQIATEFEKHQKSTSKSAFLIFVLKGLVRWTTDEMAKFVPACCLRFVSEFKEISLHVLIAKTLNGLKACHFLKIFICYSFTTKELKKEMFGSLLYVKGHIMRVYYGPIYYAFQS